MAVSRRAFGGAVGGGALVLAGCAALPAFPGAAPSLPKVRVAGLYNAVANGPSEHLTILLQQALDSVVGTHAANLDPRLVWIAVPPGASGAPGQPYTPGEVPALSGALAGTAATAGTVPDLVALGNSYVVQEVARRQLLRPIDDLLLTTSLVSRADYFPGALAAGQVEGKTYGLPLSITPGILQYDPTLFAEAKLPPPDGTWDWKRLLEACLTLTAPPHQYAFAPYGVPGLLVFLWQNGAEVLSRDGKRCTLTDPAAVQAASFYGDLFTRHKVVAPAPGGAGQAFGFNPAQMNYNGARIALQFASSFFSLPSTRPFRYAEPFRGVAQATTLQLNSLLAMTSRAADPPADFAAMVALATELQRGSYLPPLRSLAKQADPSKAGLTLEPAEAAAVMQAATYARASPLDPAVSSAIAAKLETPLRTGNATATEACQAASDAINALLAARATG